MDLHKCSLCNEKILSGNSVYRAFDNTFCSKTCLNIKCKSMDYIDPGYRIPTKWHSNKKFDTVNKHNNNDKKRKNYIELDINELSFTQYLYLIACTFGLVGLRAIPSFNYTTLLFI